MRIFPRFREQLTVFGILIALWQINTLPVWANEQVPDCTSSDKWPANMAFGQLKNSGITNNYKLDFSKTKVVRLISQNIGKGLYRQMHDIKFTEKSGNIIEVITVSDASNEECSMSDVDVFVVSKHLK